MTAKTDLIKSLQNSGVELATSTLKRKSMAELETIWSALQDRDDAATQAVNDGKVEDLTSRETDCGGCENSECDNCGAYECCNEGMDAFDTVEDEPAKQDLVEDYSARGDLTAWMLNLAEQGKTPREVAADLSKEGKSDGQAKPVKDRDGIKEAYAMVREVQKVVTAAGHQKDPENLKAAFLALAEIAAKAADRI